MQRDKIDHEISIVNWMDENLFNYFQLHKTKTS